MEIPNYHSTWCYRRKLTKAKKPEFENATYDERLAAAEEITGNITDKAKKIYQSMEEGAENGYKTVEDKVAKGYETVEKNVTEGYKTVEDTVVGGYKTVENAVVDGFNKIADKFVDTFLTREGETTEQAKERLAAEQKAREENSKQL